MSGAAKPAATASQPSLAKSPSAVKAPQPQQVTTISDGEDDDDESIPGLVSSASETGASDVEYNSDLDTDGDGDDDSPPGLLSDEDVPGLLSDDGASDESDISEEDEQGHAEMQRWTTEVDARISTLMDPLTGAGLDQPLKPAKVPSGAPSEGKQVPSAEGSEGKHSPAAASAEPLFRPVSRGFLAQQSSILAAKDAQASSNGNATAAGTSKPSAASSNSKDRQKEQGAGSGFNRGFLGGSKPAAAPPAATINKPPAAGNAGATPADQKRTSPSPQVCSCSPANASCFMSVHASCTHPLYALRALSYVRTQLWLSLKTAA